MILGIAGCRTGPDLSQQPTYQGALPGYAPESYQTQDDRPHPLQSAAMMLMFPFYWASGELP